MSRRSDLGRIRSIFAFSACRSVAIASASERTDQPNNGSVGVVGARFMGLALGALAAALHALERLDKRGCLIVGEEVWIVGAGAFLDERAERLA